MTYHDRRLRHRLDLIAASCGVLLSSGVRTAPSEAVKSCTRPSREIAMRARRREEQQLTGW